jgi:hypothetical protein
VKFARSPDRPGAQKRNGTKKKLLQFDPGLIRGLLMVISNWDGVFPQKNSCTGVLQKRITKLLITGIKPATLS